MLTWHTDAGLRQCPGRCPSSCRSGQPRMTDPAHLPCVAWLLPQLPAPGNASILQGHLSKATDAVGTFSDRTHLENLMSRIPRKLIQAAKASHNPWCCYRRRYPLVPPAASPAPMSLSVTHSCCLHADWIARIGAYLAGAAQAASDVLA